MNIFKRGLVTAAIVGSLVGGVAAMPGGAAADPQIHNSGANCHGVEVARIRYFGGKTGLGNALGGPNVKEAQREIRDTCAST